MKTVVSVILSLFCLVASADAQTVQTARVNSNAPIYVRANPASGLPPLRVAAVGTVFQVVAQEGEWLQVQFQDPQWGLRTGWVEKRNVTVSDPNLRPMDLSIRDTSPASLPTHASNRSNHRQQDQYPVPFPTSDQQPPAHNLQTREGFWFNAGMGFGSLGCQDCSAREGGLSGGLSGGGTITDRLLLGVGTTGWAKELDGELFTVGTLDVRLRYYPMRTSGFFLTGGVGVGSVSYAGESDFGLGAVLGLGWDIRVGSNVSLTPFWNGFAMSNSTVDANVGQIGLGVTIH